MAISTKTIERMHCRWNHIAGFEIDRLEQIGSTLYGFGTELGTLRLFANYNGKGDAAMANPKTRVGYSGHLGVHYFALDLEL